MNTDLNTAVATYIHRQNRSENPSGKFDSAGRWYPSDAEQHACCNAIRSPSRHWPYSLMLHCRTAEHIAHVYDVDAKSIRAEARRMRSV